MSCRIRIRICNNHLIIRPLHEYILFFVLHLVYLFLHVLVVAVDGLPLHELLLLVGVGVRIVGERCSGPRCWLCMLGGGLVRRWLLLRSRVGLPSWKVLSTILILANMPVLRMSTVLSSVLNILILTIIIRLRVHRADILI